MRAKDTSRKGFRVGLVLEGRTEYAAIPEMLKKLDIRYAAPSVFHGQSVEVPVKVLVEHRLLKHVRVQIQKDVDAVFVVLDFEERKGPVGQFKRSLLKEIRTRVTKEDGRAQSQKVHVVVCNRKFENWLISDPKGIHRSNLIRQDLSRSVNCHADNRDADALIKTVFRQGSFYDKAVHGQQLARWVRVDDGRVHLCSESLRGFIEELRHLQAKQPH